MSEIKQVIFTGSEQAMEWLETWARLYENSFPDADGAIAYQELTADQSECVCRALVNAHRKA